MKSWKSHENIFKRLLATVIAGYRQWQTSTAWATPKPAKKQFGKCKAATMIVADAGETIPRGASVAEPFGLISKQAGTVEDYRYGEILVAAGGAGLIWTEPTWRDISQSTRLPAHPRWMTKGPRFEMSFRNAQRLRRRPRPISQTFSPEAERQRQMRANGQGCLRPRKTE